MTSKAQRKRHRGLAAALRAGRPRKEGDRYPGGKLKPPPPNPEVIARRRRLLGVTDSKTKVDLSKAENPMDVALARGWLTEAQHKAGEAYASFYRLSGAGLKQGSSGLHEAPDTAGIDRRTIFELSSAEIVQAWDAMDKATRTPEATDAARMGARRRYLAMTGRMSPAEQHQVFRCFVQQEWPAWIDQRINAVSDPRAEREFDRLVLGLNAIVRPPLARRPER